MFVDDVSEVPGRGILVTPGLGSNGAIPPGAVVELRRPNGTPLHAVGYRLQYLFAPNPIANPFLCFPGLAVDDVPIGTEVWVETREEYREWVQLLIADRDRPTTEEGDEDAFLWGIVEDPRSEVRRLIYADWLEERGDEESLRQAEYLRVECEVDRLSPARNRKRLLRRLYELREVISPEWWRALDWAKTYHCVKFEFRCKQRWDQLTPTDDPQARHCSECDRQVHYASNGADARRLADQGECVALDSRVRRFPYHVVRDRPARMLLGRIAPTAPHRIPLPQRGRRAEA